MKKHFSIAAMLLVVVAQQLYAQDNTTFSPIDLELTGGCLPAVKNIQLSSGVNMEYVEQGSKEGIPVILLHGYTDSWHSFETVLPHLPPSLHVFAVSQRGHGNSSKPEDGYQSKYFAADIAAFAMEKKTGPVIIVGHSMGGVIAQQFVLDFPELTKAVVLISTDAAFKDNPGIPEFAAAIRQLSDPVSFEFADEFQKSTLSKTLDSSFYRVLVNESLKLPARVWKSIFDGLMNADHSDVLNTVNKPVLIVWGDKDSFCTKTDQDILVEKLKNAKLVTYSETGHALHWELPARFANDLVSFINTIK